jgi:hypothetical protein
MTTQSNQMGNPAAAFPGVAPAAARKSGLSRMWRSLLSSVAMLVCILPSFAAVAEQAGVIQTQDATPSGIVAELTQCKRSEGVLSIKVRFRNTSSKKIHLTIYDSGAALEKFYVTAGKKKYFILKDSEGKYLAPAGSGTGVLDMDLGPGESFPWWAKFPAPPVEEKKIALMTPLASPFEDAPITDQ